MKLSLIIPTPNFLQELPKELEKLGNEVLVNNCTEDCDFLIGMSQSVLGQIGRFHYLYPNVPLIVYNWDWYDFINKKEGVWFEFTRMMEECKEVWSASKITAEKCYKDTLIKSPFWNYAFILPDEWILESKDGGYVMQSSRQDWYKRFDWFETAAISNSIPFKSSHPNTNDRPNYISLIQNCSMLCCCSIDESLGTLSVVEAAYNRKPILISDFEGAKEVWGDAVWYFDKDDPEDLKATMKWVFDNRNGEKVQEKVEKAYNRCLEVFMPKEFAKRMNDRLNIIK